MRSAVQTRVAENGSAAPSMAVVVEGADKAFGETQALRKCSFRARSGEVHAIVGENGSGKSTLAKILSGVFSADRGDVRVFGQTPSRPRHAMGLGVATVFQEVLVAEGRSVLDNLFIGMGGTVRAPISYAERVRRGGEELERLTGETFDLHAPIDSLPLSQRQWVTIARALLRSPRLLILDESTAALDLNGARRLLEEARRLKQRGVCVLLVTHRIGELTEYTDRATVLRDGRDVGTLNADEITENRLLELMGGAAAHERRPAARTAAGEAGSPVLRARDARLAEHTEPFDFEVSSGEIVGLAGLEGHGQAQFLRSVAGIGLLAEGEVEVPASDESSASVVTTPRAAARAGIVYIPGDRKLEGLFPNLSILENFGVPLYRRNRRLGFVDFRRIRALFSSQARSLEIDSRAECAPIGTLSGGNQQKVVIGRSLAQSPRIIALNDPTRGVDIGTKQDLYEVLRGLAAAGKGVLFLSSEIEEFLGVCHRVAVFRDGSLQTTLSGEQITFDAVLGAMFGRSDR